MAGRSHKEVQELLGHRTFPTTLRYAHLLPDRLRDAVAALPIIGVTPAPSVAIQPAWRAASAQGV